MERLRKNLARKANNYKEWDKQMAFGIFMLEKEFRIGTLIDETFPLMKFFNIYDDYNMKKYKEGTDPKKSHSLRG